MSPAEPSELAQLRLHGQEALAAYFQSFETRLRKMIAVRLDPRLASRVDPDDILQDSFVDASRRLDEYLKCPGVPLFVWIRFFVGQRLTAVHRWHLRHKRSASRETKEARPEVQMASLLNQIVGSDTSPSLVVARREVQATLHELIDSLDPIDREILALRHFEELTNQETACELLITTAAASKRYVRALERLRCVVDDSDFEF